MSIVCGTDFSGHSRSAMSVAAALAPRLRATDLWLVHVLDPAMGSLDSPAQAALKIAAERRLVDECARLHHDPLALIDAA